MNPHPKTVGEREARPACRSLGLSACGRAQAGTGKAYEAVVALVRARLEKARSV